jgi:transketolase
MKIRLRIRRMKPSPAPLSPAPQEQHKMMANAIRVLAMDAVEKAQSGHPGMPMGMADVATVLFRYFLKFDPQAPDWPDRDRFILSAGHGSMLLYALLYLTGYPQMTIEEIKNFRQWGSCTAGHPEHGHAPGIETTTGPLGQGLANSVGMALAERLLAAHFGELVDHYTYVIASDGDLMEGISHEAISFAGHLRLHKLIVFFDDNDISIDGPTSLAVSDNQLARFAAAGWSVQAIDGHDEAAIIAAIHQAKASDRPSLIACRTVIAYGAPHKGGTAAAHGAPLGAEEIAHTREKLEWPYPPFEVPDAILDSWRQLGTPLERLAWEKRLASHPQQSTFKSRIAGTLPQGWQEALAALKAKFIASPPKQATRLLSQQVLETLVPLIPALMGGSADLTGSNNTKTKGQQPIDADDFSGQYIHYGVREHGMAAMMNGLALHGGFIPYGGTFLIFSDYLRPALRLSALMEQRVIYVLTHDSIGLGEDGPTHQPIEHLAALRAIPNLNVFRPADAMEVAECWELAIQSESTPSIIALTRQAIQPIRQTSSPDNLCARGGYVVKEPACPRQVTLFASGSEVGLAWQVSEQLVSVGIATAVVSMPCWRLFEAQPQAYRQQVIGPKEALRVAIEAAGGFGWERYLGEEGLMMGMKGFGASAPATDLYQHFQLTPAAIVDQIHQHLQKRS